MILYHGGRAAHPVVATQKELGIHCSPNVLEANVHTVTTITKCNANVSNAVMCSDMNDWASLEAFYAILEAAGVPDGRQIANTVWRSNNCRRNTREASAVMRDILLEYNITCIKYIDAHEIPGVECYILLEDQDFVVVSKLSEAYPNLDLANEYMPSDNKIHFLTDFRPYFKVGISAVLVPKSLYMEDPEYIASELIKISNEADENRSKGAQQAFKLVDIIRSDLGYDSDVLESAVSVFVNSDSFYDSQNPRVAFKGKVTSIDRRYNLLVVPVNCDLEKVYFSRIKPFIEESIR